ncbi:hypothetical protein M0813_10057 [Anaeramoeba flamelloides]|uniref:Uncharacterized protein n=1 Tax=Anaeramoeba flamelloides TaxID=1746091 RepID=A0ABQ8X3M3_9EUKA|nr:hypothetical protein M0813_10057 [Anaeramoeba flamelloides]
MNRNQTPIQEKQINSTFNNRKGIFQNKNDKDKLTDQNFYKTQSHPSTTKNNFFEKHKNLENSFSTNGYVNEQDRNEKYEKEKKILQMKRKNNPDLKVKEKQEFQTQKKKETHDLNTITKKIMDPNQLLGNQTVSLNNKPLLSGLGTAFNNENRNKYSLEEKLLRKQQKHNDVLNIKPPQKTYEEILRENAQLKKTLLDFTKLRQREKKQFESILKNKNIGTHIIKNDKSDQEKRIKKLVFLNIQKSKEIMISRDLLGKLKKNLEDLRIGSSELENKFKNNSVQLKNLKIKNNEQQNKIQQLESKNYSLEKKLAKVKEINKILFGNNTQKSNCIDELKLQIDKQQQKLQKTKKYKKQRDNLNETFHQMNNSQIIQKQNHNIEKYIQNAQAISKQFDKTLNQIKHNTKNYNLDQETNNYKNSKQTLTGEKKHKKLIQAIEKESKDWKEEIINNQYIVSDLFKKKCCEINNKNIQIQKLTEENANLQKILLEKENQLLKKYQFVTINNPKPPKSLYKKKKKHNHKHHKKKKHHHRK